MKNLTNSKELSDEWFYLFTLTSIVIGLVGLILNAFVIHFL